MLFHETFPGAGAGKLVLKGMWLETCHRIEAVVSRPLFLHIFFPSPRSQPSSGKVSVHQQPALIRPAWNSLCINTSHMFSRRKTWSHNTRPGKRKSQQSWEQQWIPQQSTRVPLPIPMIDASTRDDDVNIYLEPKQQPFPFVKTRTKPHVGVRSRPGNGKSAESIESLFNSLQRGYHLMSFILCAG